MDKHTILFLAANPVGTDLLALDEEARAIHVELERSGHRDRFDLVTRWAVRPVDLLRELRKLRPTVVHFSGHGGRLAPSRHRPGRAPRRDVVIDDRAQDSQDGLFFQDRNGRPQRVSAEALQQTFGAAGSSVRVVVLNACYSSAQAEALRAYVDCVVGMRNAIDDDAARNFAIGFYGGLGDGESVAKAFEQGRAAISLEGLHDSGRPQLHIRAGVDAGGLVLAARGDANTTATSGATARPASAAALSTTTTSLAASGRAQGATAQATMSWTQADVVILTAIELEYAAVKRVDAGAMPGGRWVEEKHNGLPVALREFVGRGESRLRVAVARAPDMGKGSALTTLQPLVDALRPACIAMCGVCAGRSGKTALGDVVVAERLYDYDAGKWMDAGFQADVRTYSLPAPWKIAAEQFHPKVRFGGETWWQERPVPYEWQKAWVLVKLHQRVARPADLPESKHRCPQWHTVIERLRNDRYLEGNKLTPKGKKRAADLAFQYPEFPDLSPGGTYMPFQLHVKPIGSGSAVREDVDVWGFVTPHMRTTLALEMEASALADIVRARAHHAQIDAVVMKGVMDFANHGRDDHFKDYAARASAECLIAFLRDQLRGTAGSGPSGSGGGSSFPGGGIDARIASAKQQIAAALSGHDRLIAALTARIGCRRDELAERLVTGMPAADLVSHWLAVSRGLPVGPDRRRDVDALCSALFAVLPYLADWRAELEAGLVSGDGGRLIVPRFATVTVAEAIMAGLHGRQCQFIHHPELGHCGVAMVRVPSIEQTALFKSRDGSRLLEAVVEQLAAQLGVPRSGDPDVDRRRVNERLRVRAAGIREEPLQYYFVYQDAVARPTGLDAAWELTLASLGDAHGLPQLALIRMQGRHDDAEFKVEALVAEARDTPADRGDTK
jgi:nucleoside phosphorylase